MSPPIGNLIREARRASGISLRVLADRVGIHFSHLSKVENGRDTVGSQTLRRIAEELGADPEIFLGEAGHQAMPFRIVGDIAAGVPIEAVEDFETFDLAKQFDPQQHFLLRVKGESMIEAGITSGDLAIIRHSCVARNGQIVAAVVDGEATLKRFQKSGQIIRLIPENSEMSEMQFPAADVEIRGIFAGLIRAT
ncbi:MAG: transcriptional repressor LexA [Planctomycetaceae bacterium]|nr:transcriptional repressor LexA [Planctomycetaceae bacterium]